MFQPLSLFVGLRYVRARTQKFFVSFITWVSLVGVCLGVAALIVILSVMNGFEGELRGRLLALTAHARVTLVPGAEAAEPGVLRERWSQVAREARAVPGVVGAAPYVEIQALAMHSPEMLPVLLRGVDPAAEPAVTEAADSVIEGRLADLVPGADRVVVGSVIAKLLGLGLGERMTLLVPGVGPDGAPQPRLREFTIAGIFEVGLQDHDGVLVLADLEDARALTADDPRAAGLRLKVADALQAPAAAAALQARLPEGFEARDWTRDHANYFRAIRIEKTMMALILLLIVAVAAFNIVAMLVMVVTDKRTDIAILRTLGASPGGVMGVFLTQGLVIGWFGVALGVALGVAVAANVADIVPVLEGLLGFRVMNPDVYYITRIPSELRWDNVAWIGGAALLLTGLATVYPALRASKVAPAEALRYE
ncbi:MAG: lipoprotein-releasing ABC transporter permease subunit [Steroidobacteraceae bacterium]|jgi:lipoprotein-releasing system permease protein|nr:lipoprotein-releasing ABC transporter permease subunit [Steroidobacteraceae bacterium]